MERVRLDCKKKSEIRHGFNHFRKTQSPILTRKGFPGASDGEEPAYNVGDPSSIPGLGRSPGEGKGNPLQYFCLENPMDREAWQATVHRVAKHQTQLRD